MEKTTKPIMEEIQGTVNEIISQLRRLIKEGNARKVLVKNKNGKILFQSQLTIGVAGTAFLALYAPVLTAISSILLYASDVRVFVEKEVDESRDEYEVEAEVIEIDEADDEEDEEEEKAKKSKTKKSSSDKKKKETDKTVGKKKK
ncbi:MAG: DUF4342 domain-containing protein [Balneolaceae bacterium]|nr:DUF4342 domain-containing protein [Balneolaceae bacterium]